VQPFAAAIMASATFFKLLANKIKQCSLSHCWPFNNNLSYPRRLGLMSVLRPEDSFDSCATPAVSKRRRPVLLSVEIGSPTYQSCLKVSRQDDGARLNTANMSFGSDCLDRSYTSAASSMRVHGMFSARSLHLQSLHCSPLSHSHCGVLRSIETLAGTTSCSAAAVLVPTAQKSFFSDISQVVVNEWFQDAVACSSTIFHVEVDIAHCSQQVPAT
jgi:hypothetical protein